MTTRYAIEPGWTRSDDVDGPPGMRVLRYGNGTIRIRHNCKVVEGDQIICAPLLRLGDGHVLVQRDPLTVVPSIACPDCELHGFIREGRWVPA